MRELETMLEALRGLPTGLPDGDGDGELAVLASVVHVEGSTYRRPGARMLLLPDESMIGLIGGGCLEGDLLAHAAEVRETRTPRLVRYDATREDDIVWGLGLGCAGIVEVLLETVSADRPGVLEPLAAWREQRATGAIATCLEPERLGTRWLLHPGGELEGPTASEELRRLLRSAQRGERRGSVDTAEGRLGLERALPPLHLAIFGAGPDVPPVVALARSLGWSVDVADPRAAYARPERFAGARVHHVAADQAVARVEVAEDTFALVMTHHYLHDRAVLADLLGAPTRYVGLLGPRRRADDLLADLRESGRTFPPERLQRLHAPAGLDVGGDGPEAIALSLVAEIQAVAEERRGGWLRDRKGPIHEPGRA